MRLTAFTVKKISDVWKKEFCIDRSEINATFVDDWIGFDVVDSIAGTGVTVRSTGNAVFSGVITATKFVGDISDATGAAAGLGTALSQTQTSPLNKIYFTDNILSIGATVTIDPPPSSTVAYTNYSDIKITGSADLIISDGDEFS